MSRDVSPRGGVDRALALLSEGQRFESRLGQLWSLIHLGSVPIWCTAMAASGGFTRPFDDSILSTSTHTYTQKKRDLESSESEESDMDKKSSNSNSKNTRKPRK